MNSRTSTTTTRKNTCDKGTLAARWQPGCFFESNRTRPKTLCIQICQSHYFSGFFDIIKYEKCANEAICTLKNAIRTRSLEKQKLFWYKLAIGETCFRSVLDGGERHEGTKQTH